MKKVLVFIGLGLIIILLGLVLILLKNNYIRIPKKGEITYSVKVSVTKDYLTGTTDWREAETKWKLFEQEHLERMRQIGAKTPAAKLPDYKFDREFMEIKSPLITKYLPNYRIFTEKYFEFVLGKDGHIICLGETWPGKLPFQSAPDFELMDDSAFLRTLEIRVNDARTATEVVKLVRVLHSRNPTTGSELIANWVMKTQKKQDFWIITMDFVGPPHVSIMMPPSWKISVDEKNQIMKFKELPPGGEPCDFDKDWNCDEGDFNIFQSYLGECAVVGGGRFNVQADVDNDLCITIYDQKQLFPETLPELR